MNKEAIIKQARAIYKREYYDVPEHQGCVYWAQAFQQAARGAGLKCEIHGGSALFQFRADDGKNITHHSYMFDPQEAMARIRKGMLPEMHGWNYLPDTGEVVDVTTRFQARQADDLLGFKWEPEYALPEYFWGKPRTMRILYHPHPIATVVARMAQCTSSSVYNAAKRMCKKPVVDISGCANMSCDDGNDDDGGGDGFRGYPDDGDVRSETSALHR